MDQSQLTKSTPSFSEFSPYIIPFQHQVLWDINNEIDFSLGTHEILFSGSVGSSKSLLAAHIVVNHCINHPKARVLIGRRSLPDLKKTLFQKIAEHLDGTKNLTLNKDYWINESIAHIYFRNGSEIVAGSWADKRYMKFRSLELSMAVIEEAVENKGDDYQAIKEIRQRVGRLPHIKQNMILYPTNPDGPSHPLYKYFISEKSPTRRVYYSLTEENPFLPKTYIEQLKRDMPFKEAERMLFGKWIEIDKERIYYAYNQEKNRVLKPYEINPRLPISIAWDFNIGLGKPMSCCLSQYDIGKDTFYFFDEIIIHGSRTEDVLEELAGRGYLELNVKWEVHGDATGGSRTTNSKLSNYEIIESFLANYKTKSGLKLNYQLLVPKSNPPVRERHNIVNAYCLNSLKEMRLFVYEKCKTLNEGMMNTCLKKGADYIEDDGPQHPYQHVTTSLGYRVCWTSKNKVIHKGGNI